MLSINILIFFIILMYNLYMYNILLVDDTRTWLLFHKEIINQLYGKIFQITLADSAKDAYDIIRRNTEKPFDIIITDLQMESDYEPELAGEWLIKQIKNLKEYSRTNIIIISAMFNIEFIAKKYNVECIPKNILIRNKLLLKFMFEKIMPFLTNI